MHNPQWFKDAVIYELHVKTFQDSDGDGVGDFRGLIEPPGLLHGTRRHRAVACSLFILPRCGTTATTSPITIAINPSYGTLDDFQAFLTEAHERGLRVITELVLNHTSDQNAWFQRARRAPAGIARARLLRLERRPAQIPRRADHL